MTKTILMVGLLAAITILLVPQAVSANQDIHNDVSVWDSDVPIDVLTGIYPIGGSGQIDGHFVVDTTTKKDTAIQVALRAQDRFVGPIESMKNIYLASPGESDPGLATWNFDWSVDMGSEFLENQLGKDLTSQNLRDFSAIIEITDNNGNSKELDFALFPFPAGPIVLSQSSQNIGFDFIGLPIDSDVYDIALTISNAKGKTIAESEIKVVVTDEVPEDGKINICHKDKKTINVSVNAIKSHLKHGDTIGACTS